MSDKDDYEMRDMLDTPRDIRRSHVNMDAEFRRLCAEPCMKRASVGDRAVVAIGFIGHGFLWIRQECEVVEVGDTTVKVRWHRHSSVYEEWVNPNLITDVLPNTGATP